MNYYIPIIITIAGLLSYHILQKSVPTNINPVISLLATYFAAFLGTLVLFLVFPLKESFGSAVGKLNWIPFGVGITIIAIEVGYLLAYRVNWNIPLAVLSVTVTVALISIPIGIIFFKEQITVLQAAGMVFSIIGIILLTIKW